MNLGESIKTIRKAQSITRKDAAAMSGISTTALYNIETGRSLPSISTLQRLAQAFGVPMAYLLVFSVTEDDVAEDKRTIFRQLILMLKDLLIPKEDEK